jgi:hypothetical protein
MVNEMTAPVSESLSPVQPKLVDGRSCGTCSMCCKVFDIPPVENKLAGSWCKHCKPGSGCGIWEARPKMCADYFCHWRYDASLGPEWRPDVAKFLVSQEPGDIWLSVIVDKAQPNAWRREPYHTKLRALAARLIEGGKHGLMLIVGDSKYVILPDREILIGTKNTHANVRFKRAAVNGTVRYDVELQVAA